jgi:hypothetical protein
MIEVVASTAFVGSSSWEGAWASANGTVLSRRASQEVLEAAESASDPVIAAAYTRIARDEQRHAELAFRFVRWALEREPQVASRVALALSTPHPSLAVQDVIEPWAGSVARQGFVQWSKKK